MSDVQHLKLIRPSNFARTVLCPGWSRLAAAVPAPPASDAAEEGTKLHSRLSPDAPLDDLTPEQQRQVEKARAFVAERATGYECYECMLPPVGSMANGGTADVLIETDGVKNTLVDLKFGRLPLSETFAAWQGLIYAEAARGPYKKADVWFYQPRVDEADGKWFAEVTVADGVPFQVDAALELAKAESAPRVPGAEQCRYCPALAWCPEAAAVSATFAVQAREPRDGLSPIQLGSLGALAKRVEGQAKAVLTAIREIMLAGGAVPGFTLETRKGSRHIPDAPAAYEALKDVLPLEQFLAVLEVPLGALEDEWLQCALDRDKAGTKKALREEFYRRLAHVVARKPDTKVLTFKEGTDGTGTGSPDNPGIENADRVR